MTINERCCGKLLLILSEVYNVGLGGKEITEGRGGFSRMNGNISKSMSVRAYIDSAVAAGRDQSGRYMAAFSAIIRCTYGL